MFTFQIEFIEEVRENMGLSDLKIKKRVRRQLFPPIGSFYGETWLA